MQLKSVKYDKNTSFEVVNTSEIIVHYRRDKDVRDVRRPLRQVNKRELLELRIKNKPTFILKINDELFVTEIDYYDHLFCNQNAVEPEHLCSNCRFCRALLKELGGCDKVRDCSLSIYCKKGNSYIDSLDLSKRIEKYDFIKYGYETFGVELEIFCVADCTNFKGIPARW